MQLRKAANRNDNERIFNNEEHASFKINRVAIKSAFVYTIKVRIKDVGMLSKSPDISHRKSFFLSQQNFEIAVCIPDEHIANTIPAAGITIWNSPMPAAPMHRDR